MKYTEKQIEAFFNTTHAGVIMGADIAFKTISKETGDAVKIFLVIEDGIVKDAKFQACGSVVLYASLSSMMELLIGKTVEDARTINEKVIIREIKQVNRCDYATVTFAVLALQNTINAYYKKLNRLNGKEVVRKLAKARILAPANQVSVYKELESNIEEENNPFEKMVDPSKDEETTSEKVVVEEIENKVEVEEDLTPISLALDDAEILSSVPTKIEVRVVEDEVSEEETMREQLISPITVKEERETEEKDEDVIDEIDSITAKLTDAITKLNFKFDIDE